MKNPAIERKLKSAAFAERVRHLKKYWLMYFSMLGTATLSGLSGFLLAHAPDEAGAVAVTVTSISAGFYYAVGFLTNGEGATMFWFNKLTDHDEDNTQQLIIAWVMMALAITTSLITASAAAALVAFLLGELDQFPAIPAWAQQWIVWSIPVLWVVHFIFGSIFRAISDESKQMRELATIRRNVEQKIRIDREKARADMLKARAPMLARQAGEADALRDLDQLLMHTTNTTPQASPEDVPENERIPNTILANSRVHSGNGNGKPVANPTIART